MKKFKLLVTILLFVALPVSAFVLTKQTFFRPKAGSVTSPLAFLEQSIKVPAYIGTTNSKTPQSTIENQSQEESTTSALTSAPTGGTGESDTKSYGREITPSVLGTVSGYTGSASFSLPISTPTGPGGMGPNVALSYSSSSLDDSRLGDEYFKDETRYPVSYTPHGFGLGGFAAITRDTRKYPESPTLGDDPYHRLFVSLPTGESFEIKYNPSNEHWISIPNSFIKVEHFKPGSSENQPFADKTTKSGQVFNYVDAGQFIITTRDGTAYYFGEENLPEKLDGEGKINGSTEFQEETWRGTKGGSLYNEFYRSKLLCRNLEGQNTCPEDPGERVPNLFVKKWLLKQVIAPSGQKIDYAYDVWQRSHKTNDTNPQQPRWLTTTAYPRAITWNEGKYSVDFSTREALTNTNIGEEEYIRERIKKITVGIKNKSSNKVETVRSFELTYFGTGDTPCGLSRVPGRLSLLKSFQEVGYDGTTKTPPVSFCYKEYDTGGSPKDLQEKSFDSTPSVYLTEIKNGYGGSTNFEYETVTVPYYNKNNDTDGTADGFWGSTRTRVTKEIVTETTENKSYIQEYTYGTALGYSEELGDSTLDSGQDNPYKAFYPPTGLQFLGHSFVEVKKYDFTGSPETSGKLLSHTRSEFFQANKTASCFEPHPARGSAEKGFVYNQGQVAVENINMYRYRLDGNADQDPSTCKPERIDQPMFVYLRRSDAITSEPTGSTDNFIQGSQAPLSEIKESLKLSVRTGSENISFDEYGFLSQSADLGEMDLLGNESEDQKKDNRYYYTHNLDPDLSQWMLGFPYLTYASTTQECGKADQACQVGRTESFYDENTNLEKQQLENGQLTKTQQYLEKDKISVTQNKYDQYGNLIEIKGSAPNQETTAEGNLIKEIYTKYDNYYHTLVVETQNTLGHQSLLENYHPSLQVPQRIKVQTSASPNKFMVTETEYDALGRSKASYTTNDTSTEAVLPYPASYTHYFETPDQPLVVRTMSLSSVINGVYKYQTADVFYDGLGQVKQAQNLASSIRNQKQRTVVQSQYNANGQSTESYDLQVTSAVEISDLASKTDKNKKNADTIKSKDPQLETLPKDLVAESEIDELGRTLKSAQKELDSGQIYITTNQYLANASKVIDVKGVETISVVDVRGRTLYSLVADKDWANVAIKKYSYEQPLIDQPTKTEIYSPSSSDRTELSAKYDSAGRLLESTDPSLGTHKYTYDIRGNTSKEEFPGGSTVSFKYDNLNRIQTKEYSNANKLYNKVNNSRSKVEYSYDFGNNNVGKLIKVVDLVGQEEYVYDNLQRLITTKKTILDNKTQTFTSQYNKLSQLEKITRPDSKYSYIYDAEGRVTNILLNEREKIFEGFTYDKYGNQVGANLTINNKKFQEKSTRDNLGKLKSLTFADDKAKIFEQNLTYNPSGEIAGIAETNNLKSENLTFEYDSFSRLLKATSGTDIIGDYQYDIFGRITLRHEGTSKTESTYNNTAPFFAPKKIKLNLLATALQDPSNTTTITGPPAVEIPAPGMTPGAEVTPGRNIEEYDLAYTPQGSLVGDNESCYDYNDLNQLVALTKKKSVTDQCPLNLSNSTKKTFFYYDHKGTLVLQEEYDPRDLQKPTKRIFLYGDYEETFELK